MGSGKAITKRLLANATYEQLLDDDLRVQAKRDKKNWEKDDKQVSHNDPAKKSDIRLTLSMLSPNGTHSIPSAIIDGCKNLACSTNPACLTENTTKP